MTVSDHPPEAEILRYLDDPDGAAAERLEEHLAGCLRCRERLLALDWKRRGEAAPETAPAELVARARTLAGTARRQAEWSPGRPALAAAAALAAVAAGLALWWAAGGRATDPGATWRAAPEALPALEQISPPAGSAVGVGPVRFRWRPLAGAQRYILLVLDERGDILAETETTAPEATVDLAALSPHSAGARAYWSVAAILADGTTIESDHLPLTLGP